MPSPWDVGLEQLAIGTCLRDSSHVDVLAAEITAESFHDPYHQRVWDRILAGSTNLTTLANDMRGDPGWAETGAEGYLEAMRAAAPAKPPLKDYIKLLRDMERRRGLWQLAKDLSAGVFEPASETPTQALTDKATAAILALASSYSGDRTQSLSAVARGRLDMAEKRASGHEVRSISTGLKRLDKAMGGLQPGDHMLLAGRSGAGKSALAGSIGRAVASSGHPVLIICADMTKERWAERVLCEVDFLLNGGIDPISYGWFRGKMSDIQLERLAIAHNEMSIWPCDICDEGQINTARIRAKAHAMANRYKGRQGLLITDFLQKLPPPQYRHDERRDESLTTNAYEIGDIVKDIGWSALTLAQLKNKDTDAKGKMREDQPNETDIRESGGLIQAADIAFAIHRKAYFVERREPSGRDYHPEPPADWLEWEAELNACKDEAQLIGFKNRDSSVTALHMTLWCNLASNVFLDQKPGRASFTAPEVEELQF